MKKTFYIMILLSASLLAGCSFLPEPADIVDTNKWTDTINKKDIVVNTDTEQTLTGENDKWTDTSDEDDLNNNPNNMWENLDTVVAKKWNTVYVNYVWKTEDGKIFDTSIEEIAKEAGLYDERRPYEPLTFQLGGGQMIAWFDKWVEGMVVGEKKTITLSPEEWYGEVDPNKKSTFKKWAMVFGNQWKITEVTEEGAVIDLNGEMAGKTLVFEITMVESDTYPVADGSSVKVDYTGTFTDGEVFDSSKKPGRTPLPFTVGAKQMIKWFDAAVIGMNQWDTKTVTLEPKDAYGEADPKMILNLKVWDIIPQLGTLAEVDVENQTIVVDRNHFLAGKILIFEVELTSVE